MRDAPWTAVFCLNTERVTVMGPAAETPPPVPPRLPRNTLSEICTSVVTPAVITAAAAVPTTPPRPQLVLSHVCNAALTSTMQPHPTRTLQ